MVSGEEDTVLNLWLPTKAIVPVFVIIQQEERGTWPGIYRLHISVGYKTYIECITILNVASGKLLSSGNIPV